MNLYFIIASIIIMEIQPSDEIVWHWFSQCPKADTMCVEILLQNKIIYKTSFPVCAKYRNNIKSNESTKVLKYYFKADCNIFKTGEDAYLDSLFRSFGIQRIEGNIWEAGKDTNEILLGISFIAKNQILLNSIHFAMHDYIYTSEQAKGLFVKTYLLHKKQKEWIDN